jgi:hypothetical protein
VNGSLRPPIVAPGRSPASQATSTAGPAAHFARLKIAYGPRWHITASIPGLGPRVLTATETGTGRRIQARNEAEMESKLLQVAGQSCDSSSPGPGTMAVGPPG